MVEIISLIRSGSYIPLILIICLLCILVLFLRLPPDDLGIFIKHVFVDASEKFLWLVSVALVLSNGYWIWYSARLKREYQREIDRLAEYRSILLHLRGESGNDGVKIEKHRSHKDNGPETHLFLDDDQDSDD